MFCRSIYCIVCFVGVYIACFFRALNTLVNRYISSVSWCSTIFCVMTTLFEKVLYQIHQIKVAQTSFICTYYFNNSKFNCKKLYGTVNDVHEEL